LAGDCQTQVANSTNCNTLEPAELLQQSAVEILKTFRNFQAHYLGYVVTIVTTDFGALYAYKHGDYEQCLKLSTQNVCALLDAYRLHFVPMLPEFIQFLDDDIVSVIALTLIVNPQYREDAMYASVSQLTLSLYLMTQCQLKLRHSLTSLAQTLDYIEIAQRGHKVDRTLDHLTLKLIENKLLVYMSTMSTITCSSL